jgi:hypothetical protein
MEVLQLKWQWTWGWRRDYLWRERRLAYESASTSNRMIGSSSQNVGAERIPVRLCEMATKLATMPLLHVELTA